MNISSLRVQHTRKHSDIRLEFTSRVTVITGDNGSGKTTLLEGIYTALRGSSFRATDVELLQKNETWWRIDVSEANDTIRTVTFDSTKQSSRKKFDINGKINYRLPAQSKYPVVLFDPADLRLLEGSPQRRRAFIDTFITQFNPEYSAALHKYERSLKQRNALLKQPAVSRDDVFVWDLALAQYGTILIEQRTKIIEKINQSLEVTYRSIAANDDAVKIHYSDTKIDGVEQKLLNELHRSFEKDTILGFTSTGPHRHDVLFEFNGAPAVAVASRGEVRSIILALKFIEVEVVEKIYGKPPVILLDDVFAELDQSRQHALAQKCRGNQMFITSTSGYEGIDKAMVISLH